MITAAEPIYISRLALQSNPFSSEVAAAGLYLGREVKQRLDLLQHLLRANDCIPLLYGAEGLGKTTTLKALMQRGGDDLRYCFIQAEVALTTQILVSRCLQAFGAPQESVFGNNSLQVLQQRLQQLQKLNIRPVVLIDDVSKLAEPVREQLKVWFDWQHNGHYLWRAVLTDSSAQAFSDSERTQPLMIGPLAEEETGAYLLQRLQGAGFQGDLPFTAKNLRTFHRQSAGYPARLNRAAHLFLLGQGHGWQRSLSLTLPAIPKLPLLPKWCKWLAWAPVGITLILLLVYQQTINDWLSGDQSSLKEETVNHVPTDDLPMIVVDAPAELVSVEEADRLELLGLLQELEQSSALPDEETTTALQIEPLLETLTADDMSLHEAEPEQTTDSTAEQSAAVESAEAVNDTAAITEQEIDPLEGAAAVEQQNSVVQQEEADIVATEASTSPPTAQDTIPIEPIIYEPRQPAALRDKEWVLKQSATAFTFQLMGTWDRAEVDTFVKKYALTGNVAVFDSMRDGKVWYSLIYGVYPSKDVAMRSSKQWAAPLSGLSPWLRRYDGVQKQIIEKAPTP